MSAARKMPRVKQPLEGARALASILGRQAFRQVEGNHHAHQASADALQQAAEKQRPESVGKGDHGNANDKNRSTDHHQGLASQPVGKQPGKQGGEDAAQQHRGNNDRELAGVQAGGGFQVRQRAADDADIHSIEQPAQPRNQQKQAVISGVRIHSGYGWHRGDQARRIELQTIRITCGRKTYLSRKSGVPYSITPRRSSVLDGCPSIRSKVLSRAGISCPVNNHRVLAKAVEDQ